MGRLTNLVGSGIGLASEALASRKARKATAPSPQENGESSSAGAARRLDHPDDPPPEYEQSHKPNSSRYDLKEKGGHPESDAESSSSEEEDEEHWELDEAARTPGVETLENGLVQNQTELADEFMRNHLPPPYSPSEPIHPGRLPCPVIIPQRRPNDNKRGFVRAYAPVLEECGIDQATFMDFLKSFHTASQADGYFEVVNSAATVARFTPSLIAKGASLGVRLTVGIAMDAQSRSRYEIHDAFSMVLVVISQAERTPSSTE